MAAPGADEILSELGLQERQAPELFRSAEDVAASPVNGYTHVLRRSWKSFDGLLGVFSVRGRPTLYIQEATQRQRIDFREQQRFWSNGIAPMLVRVTSDEVQVYSGLRVPALVGENVDENERLVTTFERSAKALEFRQFIRSVEAGTVYGHYTKHFDPTQAVDQRLVQNLRATRDQMSSGNHAPDLTTIHRFLGRVLFTCYLEARTALVGRDFGRLGAGPKANFQQVLNLPIADARRALSRFFRRLARYFRGNLFEDDLGPDLGKLRDEDLFTLRELLNGTDLFSGQYVLPFDTYDFSVIPIETISAVYEDFIRAEGPTEQRRKGAYYTPPKLVQFTMDLATEEEPDVTGKRTLDPGCGSGVFLVSVFNRKAEVWVRQNEKARNSTRAQALANILREEICGVDLSLIACQATCFSLYMAMLDCLEPPEIRRLGKDRLPLLLLRKGEKRRQNGPHTVIHDDFLTAPFALESQKFHLIVGNPPWVARGNVEKGSIAQWQKTHPSDKFPIPAKQVACAFMWNIPKYLEPTGRACLLLPAKILFGDHTDEFQKRWFSRFRVDKVAQLSDLRFFLFPTAVHPTVALRFVGTPPRPDDRIDFISPKASQASLFDNVVTVEPEDRKSIGLKDLLQSAEKGEAPIHWLSYNWASPEDRKFLRRLRELAPLSDLVGEPQENKRWNKGQGFQPHGEDEGQDKPFWGPDHPFLDANRKFDLLLVKDDVEPIGARFPSPHRVRDERVFKFPLVIFNKGYSKIAFSPFDVIFRDALQAISGPKADADLLKFLTATLQSPLADYFLFHLSSKSFYRYPFLNEVLRLPFPLPADAPGKNPASAVKAVATVFDRVSRDNRLGGLGHHQLLSEAKLEMAGHIASYFDVIPDEQILIDDVVETLEQSATPARGSKARTLKTPTGDDRQSYAGTLIDSLHAWAGGADANLGARCVLSDKAGVAVLTIAKSRGPAKYSESKASADLDQALEKIKLLSPERYGSLVYLRNLAVLEPDRMHVVKPLTKRFWLRSAALIDADAAATHLLARRSGRMVS